MNFALCILMFYKSIITPFFRLARDVWKQHCPFQFHEKDCIEVFGIAVSYLMAGFQVSKTGCGIQGTGCCTDLALWPVSLRVGIRSLGKLDGLWAKGLGGSKALRVALDVRHLDCKLLSFKMTSSSKRSKAKMGSSGSRLSRSLRSVDLIWPIWIPDKSLLPTAKLLC